MNSCLTLENSISDISPIEKELAQFDLPAAQDVNSWLTALRSTSLLAQTDKIFTEMPIIALLPARSRSLLFLLTRFLKPNFALEIGTYKAGGSEIITRALRINGKGTLITTDPFGKERAPAILNTWPLSLQKHIEFMPLSSMDCFIELERRKTFFEFLFVDGDHSYEYALFDLQMAAKLAAPGAVVVMDNCEQTGVYWATKTFLKLNPDWKEIGSSIAEHDISNPFNSMHPSFPESSFLMLQAPHKIVVTDLPRSFMISNVSERGLFGFDLNFRDQKCDGVMSALIFFRSFLHHGYQGEAEQHVQTISFPVKKEEKFIRAQFPTPFMTGHIPSQSYRTVEIVLSWLPADKTSPIELVTAPIPLKIT